jgi:hypothetical protein
MILSKQLRQGKLRILIEVAGCSSLDELLQVWTANSISPAIRVNERYSCISETHADQNRSDVASAGPNWRGPFCRLQL